MPSSEEVSLLNESISPIKELKGFTKGGRVPTSASASDLRYVTQLAKADIDSDLDNKFSSLRSAFGLERKELQVSKPEDGVGVITTPSFTYEISLSLNEESPGNVTWRRCVGSITQPTVVSTEAFVSVFGSEFSILEVEVADGLDLEAIVDCVEDADPETVKIDYDKDVTWCNISLADSSASVRVTRSAIRVSSRGETSPAELIEAYVEVQTRFLKSLGLE